MSTHQVAIAEATTHTKFKTAFEKATNVDASRTTEMRDAIFKNTSIDEILDNDSSISVFAVYILYFASVNAARDILLQDTTLHQEIHDLLVVKCLGQARSTKCISDVFNAIRKIVTGSASVSATAAQLFASRELFVSFETNVLPRLKQQTATPDQLKNIRLALDDLIVHDPRKILVDLFATEEMACELQSIFPSETFPEITFMKILQKQIKENYAKVNLPMVEPGSDQWKLAKDFQRCTHKKPEECKNGNFGILLRPHDCRVCGGVFCDDHAPKKTVACQQGRLKVSMQLRCCFICAANVDKGYAIHLPPPPSIEELKKRLEESRADPGGKAMIVIEKLAEANDDGDSGVAAFFEKAGEIVPFPFGNAFKAIAAVASLVNKVFASGAACRELANRLCRLQPAMTALEKMDVTITKPIADRILEVAQECRDLVQQFAPASQEERDQETVMRGFVSWCSDIITKLRNPAKDFAKIHQKIDRLLLDHNFAMGIQNSIVLDRENIGGGIKFKSDELMQNYYQKTAAAAANDFQSVVNMLQQQNHQFDELKTLTENLRTQIQQFQDQVNGRFDQVMRELKALRREVRGEVAEEEENEPTRQQQQPQTTSPSPTSTTPENNQSGKTKEGCSCVIC